MPFTADGGYLEYSKASNPIASGATPPIPLAEFPAALHAGGPSRVIPLDISDRLRCPGPASSPGLLASFVRVNAGEELTVLASATSQLWFALSGHGSLRAGPDTIPFGRHDVVTIPVAPAVQVAAESDAVFYWVHDEPLLRYLGAVPSQPRFRPTLYRAADWSAALAEVAADPLAGRRSRVSVLLTNKHFDQTLTVTHVLWAMLGLLPVGAVQLAHAHQSVALDLIIDCQPGCYTLVGSKVDGEGKIIDPVRVDWQPGGAFVTPPGHWHEHHNESGHVAHLMPIQDAGLHTYLRTLDIRFHRANAT